jgi:hypothetical protein
MAAGDLLILKKNASGGWDEVPASQATSAQVVTGTDNTVMATPMNIHDAEIIPIHVGITAPSNTAILWLDTN